MFKKPEAVVLRRKNILRPFEDATSVVSLFPGDFLKKTLTQSSSCFLGFAWQVMSALLLPELIQTDLTFHDILLLLLLFVFV